MTTPWQEVRALAEKATAAETVARHAKPGTMDARIADDTWHAARAELSRAAMALIRDPAFIGMMEDAARYRWLRDKFPLDTTVREWEEEESRTNKRIVNVVRREIFWDYDFYDAAADLCGHCESEGDIPTLDAAIDTARASSAGEGSDAQ
jgi:hypothetical protein